MTFIYETPNYFVESFDTPHVSRLDGGHIKIVSKKKYLDRTKISPKLAIEFIRLTMIVGEAFTKAMKKQRIELARINYQDMGNWAFKTGKTPYFHIHVYGRAKNAIDQPYKEAVNLPDRSTGFYDKFEPLNLKDVDIIKSEIKKIEKKKKYRLENWGLK